MEEFQDQLRSSIIVVLSSLSSEEVNGVIQTLVDVGVETLSDLKFVREEDLQTLKPIQRRKLVKSWTTQSSSFDQPEFRLPKKKKSGQQSNQQDNPVKKGKLGKRRRSELLNIFSKYKTHFYRPGKEYLCVWQDIASEMKKECILDVDFLECYIIIVPLMRTFLSYKRNGLITTKRGVRMYTEMQNAFEIPGDHNCVNMLDSLIGQLFSLSFTKYLDEKNDCQLLKRKQWSRGKRVKLLRVFSRHKMQICSDTDRESVWEGIADEMNRNCSLNFEPLVYQIKIFDCIDLYMTYKKKGANTAKEIATYAELQKAFNSLGNAYGSETSVLF